MREGSHDASDRHELRHCGGDNDMVQVYMHTHNTQGHIMTRHTTHTHTQGQSVVATVLPVFIWVSSK